MLPKISWKKIIKFGYGDIPSIGRKIIVSAGGRDVCCCSHGCFVTVQTGRCCQNGDLTEVWRTRPERTMSGVVRGLTESSVPVGSWLWRGNPAGMNSYGDRLHFSKRIAVLNS